MYSGVELRPCTFQWDLTLYPLKGLCYTLIDLSISDIWHGLRWNFLWVCSRKGLRITYKIIEGTCNGNIRLAYNSACYLTFRTSTLRCSDYPVLLTIPVN